MRDAHRLYVQIVTGSGALVTLPGGEVLERDLITACADAILARCTAPLWQALADGVQEDVVTHATATMATKRIGLFTPAATVLEHAQASVRSGLDEAQRAHRVKLSMPTYVTEGEVRAAIEVGIRTALQDLKDDTRYAIGAP